jgi:hypothetical protein
VSFIPSRPVGVIVAEAVVLENLPLVALTGWGQNTDRRRSAQAGFDRHLVELVKPTALDELLAGLTPKDQ